MLNLLASRYNEEIENEVFSRIKIDFKEGKKVYVVVPEQFTLQNEIKLMETLNIQALMDVKVMSFNKLAIEAFSIEGGLKRRYIDNIGKSMAVKKIFQKSDEEIQLYRGSIDKEGFISSIVKLMAEMKRTMVKPENLRESAQKNKNNILLSQKLTELAIIYEEFEASLEGKYIDNEDRIGQFAEMKNLAYLKDIKFYFYSFFSFTEIENQVIRNMIQSELDITMFLNLDYKNIKDKAEDTFAITNITLSKLSEICKDLDAKYAIDEITRIEEDESNDEIRYLGDNLFRTIPNESKEIPQKINIYHAHNLDEEIRKVAIDINHKIIDEDYRFRDIIVIPCDGEVYNKNIKLIFTEHEIPFFIDEKRTIISSPIIKTIIAVLNLIDSKFKAEDILMFLKNGFSKIYDNECDIFENHLIKRKLKGEMFFDDKYFEPEYFYENEQEKQIVSRVREYIINIFETYRNLAMERVNAGVFAMKIFEILINLDIPNKVQAFVEKLKAENYFDEANENGQIWNVFVKIIDQSVELLGEEEISFSYYKEILKEGLVNYELSVIPPSKDQVIVGDIERSRSMDKKIVYILGANSSSMPRTSKENGLLTKEDKESLKEQGILLPSNQDQVDANEALLIYNILTKPSDELNMSYAVDIDGSSVVPSIILNQISMIYPKLKVKNARDFKPEYFMTLPKPTIAIMAREIKKYSVGEHIDEIWLDLLSYYLGHDDYKSMANIALEGIFYDNTKTPIGNALAKKLYKTPLKVSTTRIDSFVRCPFSHFIKYGLRAKERKVYNIEPAEMGQVLHLTIEKFIEKIKEDMPLISTIDKAAADEMIGDIFDEAAKILFKEYDLKEKRNQYILKKLKKTAHLAGFSCVEQVRSGKFELMYQEEKFAQGSEIPPIIIDIDGEQIMLEGTIDRVDILKDGENSYVKVIDYKTRSKSFNLSDAYNGLDIQLVIYLKAAMKSSALLKTKTFPAGIFYFPIINPMLETQTRDKTKIEELIKSKIKLDGIILHDIKIIEAINGNSSEGIDVVRSKGRKKDEHLLELNQFEALIDKVQSNVYESLEDMIKGIIDPNPVKNAKDQSAACDYCRYGAICRFDEELETNNYRNIVNYKNDEVIKMLEGGETDEQ
ncbi:MAG: PD-(D/E)XK nuclease family protein [Proteocatella sp.]